MARPRSLRDLRTVVLPLMVAARLVVFVSDVPLALAAGNHEGAPILQESVFSQEDFLAGTNAARQAAGLPGLTVNESLAAAAQAKADDMAVRGYWDHFRPEDGKAPWDFIRESGYEYKVAGENLARGFQTPEGITRAWIQSPTHRANLLSSRYTDVGFASVRVIDAAGNPILLTVQMFGSR